MRLVQTGLRKVMWTGDLNPFLPAEPVYLSLTECECNIVLNIKGEKMVAGNLGHQCKHMTCTLMFPVKLFQGQRFVERISDHQDLSCEVVLASHSSRNGSGYNHALR